MIINGEEVNTTYPNRHPLYSTWVGIKTRCYNPKHDCFHSYGGKGIYMCDEWKEDFTTFYSWAMSHGWRKGLVIDRINNDGPYEPNNCQFLSEKLNQMKKFYHIFFLDNGVFNRDGYAEFGKKSINKDKKSLS